MRNDDSNTIAESYGKQWIEKSDYHAGHAYHRRYQEKFIHQLFEQNGGGTILECGAGTGAIMEKIVSFPEFSSESGASCFSLDNSTTLIKHIKRKGVLRSLKQINATVEAIPFKSEIFDIVYCISVLWYVPNYQEAIKEMYRIVKPGGCLCFDVMSVLNVTGASGSLSNIITRLFSRRYRIKYVIPSRISALLKSLGGTVTSVGYMPFFPTSLPLLGDLLNIYRISNVIPEVKIKFFQNFCNKVMFNVKKSE